MIVDAGQLVIAAFLAFCRIGGCLMVMPGLSSARVPFQVRLFMAIALSLAMLSVVWDRIAPFARPALDVVSVAIAFELAVGVLIGLLARFYLLALQFIASGMAFMIGYGGGVSTAVEEMEPQAPLGSLISVAALTLLFVMDFHHQIVGALVASYRALPPGTPFDAGAALTDISDTLSETFLAALRLGSPFVAYALLVNLAIGFVNKLTPQIPVYFVSLPFTIAGGLILLYLGMAPMLRLYADGFVPLTIGR